jgi:hypothetical protein
MWACDPPPWSPLDVARALKQAATAKCCFIQHWTAEITRLPTGPWRTSRWRVVSRTNGTLTYLKPKGLTSSSAYLGWPRETHEKRAVV